VALIGSNGAGKTTLMNTIMGLVRPKEGQIIFNGKRIDLLPPYEIVNLGIILVPESKWVFPNMTVHENLLMGAYGARARKNLKQNLEKVYTYFPRLLERKNQMCGTLSGGELQMLVLGRAMMSNPQLLLVDELSIGLSPVLVEESFKLLERLKREESLTMLIAEQNVFKALSLADRGVVLENGRIVLEGPSSKLLADAEVKVRYLGM
jgi:branched-chain amino acid transport system ATP-binding protein